MAPSSPASFTSPARRSSSSCGSSTRKVSLEGLLEEESLRPMCCLLPTPRFCLMVKKGYRDPPYHNWMHAFSVSHFCYLLYKNLELTNYLE